MDTRRFIFHVFKAIRYEPTSFMPGLRKPFWTWILRTPLSVVLSRLPKSVSPEAPFVPQGRGEQEE